MLRRLLQRIGAAPLALRAAPPMLVPAAELLPRFREGGGGSAAAIALTRGQVDALDHLVEDDAGWARLCDLVARAGDPWNADDWPLGFDPLMLCAALCDDVAFECVRCPVGERQDGWSCAHPRSLFGFVLTLVAAGERSRLRRHLEDVRAVLGGHARWDPSTAQRSAVVRDS